MITKRYLQNVRIDLSANKLVFTNASRQMKADDFAVMECPNCGANNRVRKDFVGRCAFCEQPLREAKTDKHEKR